MISTMRAIIIVVGLVMACVLATFVWWLFKETGFEPHLAVPANGAITLKGEVLCLPHRDTRGPQTLECAYGLLGDDGNYYALRDETVGTSPSGITTIPTGSKVEVMGTFTRGESEIYASVGTITVDTIQTEDGSDVAGSETHSDGVITFTRPKDFGLAITEEQVLVQKVIPPCELGFEYCLYYLGDTYEGTNFESAGIAIQTRDELTTESVCLAASPEGYADMTPRATSHGDFYGMSVFSPIPDAATGHYSTGVQYRLYTSDICYQITERVGESQFENFPTGSIEQFTEDERVELFVRLQGVVEGIALNETGETLVLPKE